MPLWSFILLIGFLLSFVVWGTTSWDRPPKYNFIFLIIGFSVCIVWIFLIAREIVSLLVTIGDILGISHAILGLTILAWGNSISDLIANVVVARKGLPSMPTAACFEI